MKERKKRTFIISVYGGTYKKVQGGPSERLE